MNFDYLAGTYGRFPLTIVRGAGSLFFDASGKAYIDLGSGIGVNSFGACDPELQKAVSEQAAVLTHTSNLYFTAPQAELAEMLCKKSGMQSVFFSNSGAEANECAIKAARKYALDQYGAGRHNIITLTQSFHGRTLATLSATGQDAMHTNFDPFPEGFRYAPANDLEAIKSMADGCCAVLFELVQGEGGVHALEQAYVTALAEFAKEQDMLLIADEVQTGNGRTGTYFSYEQYGIQPDIVTTAKGLGGGMPIGATLFSEKTKDVLTPGTHGSTYGGNPVCCAAARSVVARLDEVFLKEVQERGAYIRSQLAGAKGVLSVSGLGLMIGIETIRPAADVVKGCMERGVLALTAKENVRLLPPLNIPMELLETAIGILKEELAK